MKKQIVIIEFKNKKFVRSWHQAFTEFPNKKEFSKHIKETIKNINKEKNTFEAGEFDYKWAFTLDRPMLVGDQIIRITTNFGKSKTGDIDIALKVNGDVKIQNSNNSYPYSYSLSSYSVIDPIPFNAKLPIIDETFKKPSTSIPIKRKKIKIF